jgi:transposase-like protein
LSPIQNNLGTDQGTLAGSSASIAVAVEEDGRRIVRVRLQKIPDLTRTALHGFIAASVEPGSTVRTDGFESYLELDGYVHQRHVQTEQPDDEHVLPRVHRVIGLLKRTLMGTHQGAVSAEHLDDYLNEFTFRFNRRTSASHGKPFYRLA